MRFILLFLLCLSFDVQGFVYECGFKVIDKVLVPEKGTLFKQLYIEDINISGETYKDGYRISIPLNEVSEKIMYKNIEFNTKEGVTSNVHDYRVAHHRKKSYFIFEFTAHTENGMAIESVEFSLETVAPKDLVNRTFANKSALSSGTWYKFGGKEEGVYSIEGSDLVNAGLALSSIDVSRLKVFSNGGGQLPYNNCEYRVDDLKELPLYTEGLEDFKFDLNDRILFYHNAQNQIVYDTLQNKLVYRNNAFEDSVFFFLNIDGTEGLRIMSANTYANFDNVVTDYDALIRFEQDLENLIGSGRNWYGDKFDIKTDRDYLFNLENYIPNSSATLSGSLISRSIKSESSFQISLNGNLLGSKKIGGVGPNYEDTFAIGVNFDYPFSSNNGSNQKVSLAYIKAASNSIGWLDYLEFNYLADLRVNSQPLIFQNTSALDKGIVEYRLKGCQATHMIWDVSNPFFTREVQFNIINGLAHFRTDSDSLHKFIAFEPSQTLAVKFIQEISNQNVHAYTPADLLIITPTKFISQAERLAEYRKETDGLSVQVVKLEDIYNEFSGGGKDITAIKDFLKMFYDRASSEEEIPKYALLFADGSYDNKNITFQGSYHIPTYQSENSLSPIGSYTTDDYIALLDDAEGESLSDLIDLGVGRIPINDIEQARDMVDKLISYYDERAYRNWRNEVVLVADDGQPNEGVTHMVHADQVDNVISNKYPNLNIDKIYLDAYEQIESAGGQRYPDAHRRLNEKMGQGSLILHYAGHGGELGWAHERVLGVPDIRAWSNQYNMPIMMTATCEFSRFDDHNRTAAGELVVMNPNGGAAGLFTTTRLVFGNDNAELANNFYNNLELNDNQSDLRLGDFVRKSKLLGPYSINTRNFSLLGDPSMKLSYPRNQVLTTSIPDTIRALDKVQIEGLITDDQGTTLDQFDGVVYIKVYDKTANIVSLNNDGEGHHSFKLQNQIIFKGKSRVRKGRFQTTFIVPKDIRLDFGLGKISYYAIEDNTLNDASGFETTIIGGINKNAPVDDQGPDIRLYLNDEQFVDGGLTDSEPLFYAELFDESGINTVGSGIGHDMALKIDGNPDAIILNDAYESNLDDFQRGIVKYRLSELEDGEHFLEFKAWDTHNNSGTAKLSFVVANNNEIAIDHILNYPNPFTTNTSFYFDHNQAGRDLDVSIDVMTISGKRIKSFKHTGYQKGNRFGPIPWDGRDEYGDLIGKGVYIYKVSVTNELGLREDKFEKLVLLK